MADTDVIETEAPEARAVVVVAQPGQVVVSDTADPAAMVAVASRLATVLKDIVDRQRLYADIRGKKYPTVEAWQTIARLDNVVAREPESRPAIRHEDGSWEAYAELVRLSDGMVIGSASALCGSPDDEPWGGTPARNGKPAQPPRGEHARRSMAQTRAVSRAFRQQYSWIMALAGYEPTPAEEMPREDAPRQDLERNGDGSIIGTAEATEKQTSDYVVRTTEDGQSVLGFRLRSGTSAILVECRGPLAVQLDAHREQVIGARVTAWGTVADRSFPKGRGTVTYQVLAADRIRVPDVGDLPVADDAQRAPTVPTEAESEAIWRDLGAIG